jgi:6,7-dimethyl-8-ribityllumazine synthase
VIGSRVLIVEAPLYKEISGELLNSARAVLSEAGVTVEHLTVPGALEIPQAIKYGRHAADGFVALGCVIRGETYHFDIVSNESARGLMQLALEHDLPIGNGILTVENREQAMARARAGGKHDHGASAASACLELMEIKERFRRNPV